MSRYSKAQPTHELYSKSDRLMSFEYELSEPVRYFVSWQPKGGRIYWKNNALGKQTAIMECMKLWVEKDIQPSIDSEAEYEQEYDSSDIE
ncbi:MAG: hypothetical protein ABFD50_04625 [Smithella sp.]